MYKYWKIFFVNILLVGIGLSMVSCEKYRMNRDKSIASDNVLAETSMLDLFYVADRFIRMELDTVVPPSSGVCPVRTVEMTSGGYPIIITVDYAGGCEDQFGVNRSGQLRIVLTGPYKEAPTSVTVSTIDYSVNNFDVDGEIVIGQRVISAGQNQRFQVNIPELNINLNNGSVINWNGNYTFEWVRGDETPGFIFDDEYKITGSSSGTNRDDYEYTAKIEEPLYYTMGCRWVHTGKTEIRPTDFKKRTIDFGEGNCDNKAELKIGNRNYTLSLR